MPPAVPSRLNRLIVSTRLTRFASASGCAFEQTNTSPRIRIALVQADTDYVTLSVGQTWNVMAFAAAFLPTSVQPQGLPGQLFARNPQLRLSHLGHLRRGRYSLRIAGRRAGTTIVIR